MAQQYFLSELEILEILQAELPEDVYARDLADDPDPAKRSYSSAELRAMAQVLEGLYQSLSDVNANKAISTATPDGLTRWERELFKDAQDSSLSVEARKQSLLAKRRSSGGISLPAIRSVIAGILDPVGLAFDLIPWSGQGTGEGTTGAWVLGVTPLGDGSFLSLRDPLTGNRSEGGLVPLGVELDYAAAGLTAQDLEDIQATAYTYEVAIYGNADPATLALLDRQLTMYEPARSTHVIRNNAPGPVDPNTVQPGIYLANVPWRI